MQLSHLILFLIFFNIWVVGDFYFPQLCDMKYLVNFSKLLVNLLWFTIDKKIKIPFYVGIVKKIVGKEKPSGEVLRMDELNKICRDIENLK